MKQGKRRKREREKRAGKGEDVQRKMQEVQLA